MNGVCTVLDEPTRIGQNDTINVPLLYPAHAVVVAIVQLLSELPQLGLGPVKEEAIVPLEVRTDPEADQLFDITTCHDDTHAVVAAIAQLTFGTTIASKHPTALIGCKPRSVTPLPP